MAQINNESQRELRQQINTEFGNLLEKLKFAELPSEYRLCADINEAFDLYAGNAEILTEKPKELVNLT
jgi:hypothetical protein